MLVTGTRKMHGDLEYMLNMAAMRGSVEKLGVPASACCMDAGECRRRAVHFNPPDLPVMPHKYNADRRHHIARPKRRVTNWSEYKKLFAEGVCQPVLIGMLL